jgi:hypothetical protein
MLPSPSAGIGVFATDRSMWKGLSIGLGILMLPFCILCVSVSLPLPFGSRIAVRMLLVLALRVCAGVRGRFGGTFSCLNGRLIVRLCPVLFEGKASGGVRVSMMWIGDATTGGDDAMVPPRPVLIVVDADIIGARL